MVGRRWDDYVHPAERGRFATGGYVPGTFPRCQAGAADSTGTVQQCRLPEGHPGGHDYPPRHAAGPWPAAERPPAIVLFAAFTGGVAIGVLVTLVVAAGRGWIG